MGGRPGTDAALGSAKRPWHKRAGGAQHSAAAAHSHHPTADHGAAYQGVVQPAPGVQHRARKQHSLRGGGRVRRRRWRWWTGQGKVATAHSARLAALFRPTMLPRRYSQLRAVWLAAELHHSEPQRLEDQENQRAQPEPHCAFSPADSRAPAFPGAIGRAGFAGGQGRGGRGRRETSHTVNRCEKVRKRCSRAPARAASGRCPMQ